MQTSLNLSKKSIVDRLAILEASREVLKKEFIGIDQVIDQVVDSAKTWYTLPELQERPMILNLWGMTGTGKTSLIQRFAELIKMENAFYPMDMGNSNDNGSGFFNCLEEIFEQNNQRPFIMMLDEFQHARTLHGREKDERVSGRMGQVWKMLDTGKIEIYQFELALKRIQDRLKLMNYAIRQGVIVKDGYVESGLTTFCRITGQTLESINFDLELDKRTGIPKKVKRKFSDKTRSPKVPFFPERDLDDIIEVQRGRFHAEYEVADHLITLDGPEIIKFLEGILEEAKKPKMLDCSKSLVVVAGNLDEAYRMAENMNPDIPAEVWKTLVKDISLNDIKEALSKRFRHEHIARLGNNHIIYPAIGEKEFKSYIKHNVDKIAFSFREKYGVGLKVSDNLLNLVYQEGVFPTQGYRPVNTTLDHLIRSHLSSIVGSILVHHPETTLVNLNLRHKKLVVTYINEGAVLGQESMSLRLNLANRRKLTFNDAQALTSIHEAGHVVCAALLLDDVPDAAVSVTSASEMGGFVVRTQTETLTQRDRLIRLTAYSLGGYVAEKLVYGEENITNGSSSDLANATSKVRHMLGFCGFEIGPAYIESSNSPFPSGVLDNSGELDRLTLEYMREAEVMATELLKSEQELLLRMAEALFRKGSLRKKEMAQLVNQYAKLKEKDRKKPFPFKGILEQKLSSLNGLQKVA